jgi:hypothetical protein
LKAAQPLSAQALGLEPASESSAPEPQRHVWPSGRVIEWLMPDIVAALSFVGTLPDPYTAAAIKLLIGEGSYAPEDDPRYYLHRLEMLRGMQGIVAHGVVSPQIDLNREWGDGKDVLGRRDISWADWEYAYQVLFRLGDARAPQPIAAADESGGAAQPAPDRE